MSHPRSYGDDPLPQAGNVPDQPHGISATTVKPLLRNRAFLRLWFVQAATQVGGNMALFAMTILVFSTTRSNTAVSALLATYMLPAIVLSPFAGVVVDRINLRWALVGPNVVRSALMIGLAMTGTSIPVLLLLNFGISLTGAVLVPAEGAMIPRVVPSAQIESAMGIFNLTLQASFAVGFAFLGPILVTLFGPSPVLAVVAGLYIAASIATFGLPSVAPHKRAAGPAKKQVVMRALRELRDGFAAVRGDREISRPIIHQAAATAIAGVLGVLGPALAITIGLEPSQFAVIVAPLGIGVVIGVVGLRRFKNLPRRRAAEVGLIIFGSLAASLALMAPLQDALSVAGIPVLPFVIAAALFAGAAYGVTAVAAQTSLLESMPEQVRGRVFGVLASIISTAGLVTAVLAGPLADQFSAPAIILVVGSAVAFAGFWSLRWFGPRKAD